MGSDLCAEFGDFSRTLRASNLAFFWERNNNDNKNKNKQSKFK